LLPKPKDDERQVMTDEHAADIVELVRQVSALTQERDTLKAERAKAKGERDAD
jgi:uncharacterized small protein (DUF1192 family)